MSQLFSLNLLRRGEKAKICEVSGNVADVQRLQELGICEGKQLEVVQQGCPCIVRLRGAKFCLRGEDCHCVMVELEDKQ